MNIRKILTEHTYIDKRTDLSHRLTNNEINALVQFFASCKLNEDYDEYYLHTVADNVIRKRLS